MDIKVNVDNAREVMETLRLKPEQIKQVSKHAVARTLTMTKTDINRKARELYTVKAGELTKSLKVVKAGLSGIIKSTGSPLPLTAFKMSPAKVIKTKRRLSVEVKKGGLKPIKRGFLIAKGPRQRTSIRKYPIKRLYGPSAPQMLGEDSILDSINKKATENLEKRLVHEIGRVLK
jgi:hypothetical protein